MVKKKEQPRGGPCPPRTRPDVAAKKQLKKTHSETVVKCCLSSLLAGGVERGALHRAVQDRVESYSKRVHAASIALNLLVREVFQSVPDEMLHVVQLPDFLDQTFLRQLLTGGEAAQKPVLLIRSFFERHQNLKEKLDSAGRQLSDRNIYSFGASKLAANIKTHLKTNLTRLIKKYVYSVGMRHHLGECAHSALSRTQSKVTKQAITEWVAAASKALVYQLHGWPGVPGQQDVLNQLPLNIRRELALQKKILGDEPISTVWWNATEDCYDRALRYGVYINRYLLRSGAPLRNLLPICGIKTHFITIDTSVLYGVLRDAGYIDKTCSQTTFAAMGKDHWKSVFKLSRIAGSACTFTGTVDTDGTAACFHFTRPKTSLAVAGEATKKKMAGTVDAQAQEEQLEQLLAEHPDASVVGIDPGRTNIIYAVKKTRRDGELTGEQTVYKLTRKQFYMESGVVKANKQIQKWHDQPAMLKTLAALSAASPKGADTLQFREYIETVLDNYDTLWEEYLKPRWAQQRLRLYGGKKRVFAKFFNKLQGDDKKVLVAYGSAKFAPTGSGELSVPTSRAFKETSCRFTVFPVDEFRTTAVYNGDKTTVLQSVAKKSSGDKLRGLLWCCSTSPSKSKFVNRDLNAALNIMDCLLAVRPAMMSRAAEGGSLRSQRDVVGRYKKR